MTSRFIVEFEQNGGFPDQSFSITPYTSSDIADTNGYTGSSSLPDEKRHWSGIYGVKPTLIESISWQWVYTTNLLIAYELILTTQDTPLRANPYTWLPVEAVFAVGLLLKNYWSPNSPLFKPVEQQAASMLRHWDQPFASMITMFGSGHNQQQGQHSESSSQQAPKATTQPGGYFINHLYSVSGEGKRNPQQESHTLGLNCFVDPCRGICQFRPSASSRRLAESPLNLEKSSTGPTGAIPGQSSCPPLAIKHGLSCTGYYDSVNTTEPQKKPPAKTLNDRFSFQFQCTSGQTFLPQTHQAQPHDVKDNPTNSSNHALSMNAGKAQSNSDQPLHDNAPRHKCLSITDDDLVIVNGLLNLRDHSLLKKTRNSCARKPFRRPAGASKTQQITGSPQLDHNPPHISRTGREQVTNLSGQKICNATVVTKNGLQQPCWKVCMNTSALSIHKSKYHTGQKNCIDTVIGVDGQPQPCGRVFKHANALSDHRRREHTKQKTCAEVVAGEDGQTQSCGKIFKNTYALTHHKRTLHSGQKTCPVAVIGEDGQLRPCGRIFKNAESLSSHKCKYHTGQKTCDVTVFGKDNQQQPCGSVFNSLQALSDHRRRNHSSKKICDETIIGKDGTRQQCWTICQNAKAFSDHKRRHRKRKPADVDQKEDLSLQKGKVFK
ncbi:hypothetical protein [Endozoicomonas sp. 8E]|uniref:hypothetical protein n=1 Tax=Endozoicomonas sp. 8E TaxID=3035692 RepID=UPI0029392419|nr:hypothetical protein [Endozoicomonas sp. 8E]WOG26962.1 hypothetical protein P6910_20790 [Endozoicomonas sp. 8E]